MIKASQDHLVNARSEGGAESSSDTLNTFIWNAVIERATDVHLHQVDAGVRVLYRVDGIVHPKLLLAPIPGQRLLNQLKSAAGLNAVRSFAPLEGQITWIGGDTKRDIRVTLTPVGERESAHLRILSLPVDQWNMSNLGFSSQDQEKVSNAIHSQTGLVLITGGTGSGKTTTMYSLASIMDLSTTTTYSIEDPVEFKLPFAQQIEVDERHSLTMHEGLRTILRMDPDLIMVGEIRDRDSAMVAARAALSGKLVLATIHAQDAAGAVDSLHYLGVPYHIIGSSLRLVIAQNLLRRLCTRCARGREADQQERTLFERFGMAAPDRVQVATGCLDCSSYGYQGRTGIFEVMAIGSELRGLISSGAHHCRLSEYLRQQGVHSIAYDALEKVGAGVTSFDELLRVCHFAPATDDAPTPEAVLGSV